MGLTRYLALTAAEIGNIPQISGPIAWMACHFSPYGTGLSNLPDSLPPDSLLILNDITPIHGHDPKRIAAQLQERLDACGCCGLLLDFQRPENPETAELAKHLSQVLPCPVGVSDYYAADLSCPVFLPPVPPSLSLEAHLASWRGREIWLDTALNGEIITLTEKGTETTSLPSGESGDEGFRDDSLCCHYTIAVSETDARFTLWRTREDLDDLLAKVQTLGITTAVGLYQEFCQPQRLL